MDLRRHPSATDYTSRLVASHILGLLRVKKTPVIEKEKDFSLSVGHGSCSCSFPFDSPYSRQSNDKRDRFRRRGYRAISSSTQRQYLASCDKNRPIQIAYRTGLFSVHSAPHKLLQKLGRVSGLGECSRDLHVARQHAHIYREHFQLPIRHSVIHLSISEQKKCKPESDIVRLRFYRLVCRFLSGGGRHKKPQHGHLFHFSSSFLLHR